MQHMLEIGRAMVAIASRDELLERIVAAAVELLDVERATLWLYDKEQNELVTQIATGVQEIRVSAEKGFVGEVVRTRETILVPDAYSDPRFNPQVDVDTGFRTRNILSVPLIGCEDHLVGVLQIMNRQAGPFRLYDVDLAETLAAFSGVVIQRASLTAHYLEKKEMERAMKIAQDIQLGLLPSDVPEIEGFAMAGCSQAADETGGDMYDYLPLPNGHWAFIVADATGHGIGAALVIAETRAMLRACAYLTGDEAASVSTILTTTNRLLTQDMDGGRFVTCFVGILNPETGVMTYASAGHGPLLFYHSAEDRFEEVAATGLPLGIVGDFDYDVTATFTFAPGDWALITTDGFFEAMDHDKQEFGVERMLEMLREDRLGPPADYLTRLQQVVETHVAGQPQADDLTAIAICKT